MHGIQGNPLKVVAIVQARMGSTRLPGKVLQDIAGKTMLERVVERLRQANLIDEVVIATTDRAADDVIVEECRRRDVRVCRGDENDVLDRYHRAAQTARAEVVVRVTSDCPLIDAGITDKTIVAFLEARPDYAANTLQRTYPRGLDTEVMSVDALSRAWQNARAAYERTHVTPYIYEHADEFRLLSVTGDADYSGHRWTVDTPEDLELIRAIYSRFENNARFTWREVLAVLDREPALLDLNRSIMQKALHEG